jgi:hypothetical protein
MPIKYNSVLMCVASVVVKITDRRIASFAHALVDMQGLDLEIATIAYFLREL